jgi:transglutaminase-like putative cysteine protease
MAFDRYEGQGWEVSRNEQINLLNRDDWSYRFSLPTSGTSGDVQEVIQTYTVVSELPNLIPVLPNARFLYFPTRQVGIDPEESLRSPIALTEDLTYTVVSSVPLRDRTRLQQAPAAYPERIQQYYLGVPPAIAPKLRELATSWLAKAASPLTNPYEQALYLAQYLKQHYSIQPDLPLFSENQDITEAFLFQFQGGYPDHFSTVLTLMLRSLNIPARLAVGFGAGQFNPFTGYYIVRNTDAYALPEVYFPGNGWFGFDPIPGHTLFPASVEESQTFGVLRQFWSWVAGWIPTPVSSLVGSMLGAVFTWAFSVISEFFTLFTQGWRGIFTGLTVSIGLGFCSWLAWISWQRWRYGRWLSHLPPMEGIYQQMLFWLGQHGLCKHPAQTPLEFVQQLDSTYPVSLTQPVQDICQAYVSWRYGKFTPNLSQLRQRLQDLKKVRMSRPKPLSVFNRF